MATIFDILVDRTGSENDPVPTVDPADLRSVWTTQTNSQTLVSREPFAINVDFYKGVCGPGAECPRGFHPGIDSTNVDFDE